MNTAEQTARAQNHVGPFPNAQVCPGCLQGVPESSVGGRQGFCRRCLYEVALEPRDEPFAFADEAVAPMAAGRPTLGIYALAEEIGRGGMGIVYRAVHQRTGETVALKTILPQEAGCAESVERFRRETEAAQGLTHRHALPILEVGTSDAGVPFFTMPLALGGSLHQLRDKYRGRWRQIAELLAKIAAAVQHAHGRGILHRDLKPGNILFSEDHEPLIIDFGLAKRFARSDDLTQSCVVLGTPNYVSPEQAAGGTRDLTAASDIYSLGAILFELLAGRPPFVGDNPLDVLQQVTRQSLPKPRRFAPGIPRGLETICLRCLERRPENRYASARALEDDLKRWLAGRAISAPSLRERVLKGIQACPQNLARIAGFGLALAAGLFAIWSMSARTTHVSNPLLSLAVAVENWDQGTPSDALAQQATKVLRQSLARSQMCTLAKQSGDFGHNAAKVFDPAEYGRTNHAQVVLASCLRRAGQQFRLTSQLLRCDTGEILWRHAEQFPFERAQTMLPAAAGRIVKALEAGGQTNLAALTGKSQDVLAPEASSFYARAMELAARGNQRDLNLAVQHFRRATEIAPRFARAHAMLGFALWTLADTYGESDKLSAALAAARRALELDQFSSHAHRVIACSHLKMGRAQEALEASWEAVETNPQSAGCWLALGVCLRDTGHPAQAIPWLARAAKLEPAHYAYSATVGETLGLCGYDAQAEEVLASAIGLDGNEPETLAILGGMRVWQKDFAKARCIAEQLMRRFPECRFGPSLAAWIELCDGQTSAALSRYEQLRADQSYAKTWELRGAVNPLSALAYLAKQTGDPEHSSILLQEAIKADDDLLKTYPRNPRVLHDLAATYAVAGKTEEALRLLEDAIGFGWIEFRSTKIDPRFAGIANTSRFNQLLNGGIKTAELGEEPLGLVANSTTRALQPPLLPGVAKNP